MRDGENCYHTVSCTTRAPREGEVDGVAYHFLSDEEFVARVARGEFLEHANVFGRRYGTLKSEVLGRLEAGQDVIMDIDVQGAAQIRGCEDEDIRRSHVDVFVLVRKDELRARLVNRGTEGEEELARRLGEAENEMTQWRKYQYAIVSGDRDNDREKLRAILDGERNRGSGMRRMRPDDSFGA